MILQCRICAGNITADEEAINKGIVTCDYCQTVLQVTDQGLEAYKKQILDREPPDNIKVKRKGTELKIIVPVEIKGSKLRSRIERAASVAILFVTIATGIFVRVLFASNEYALSLSCFAMLFVFFPLTYFFSEANPYLHLHEGFLLSYMPGLLRTSHKIPIPEIKQFYVTTNRVQQYDVIRTQHSLFLINKDGERKQIFGDFPSVYGALFVEELLEIELDIFNLPVLGDTQISTADVVAFQNKPDETIDCYACAAPIQINPHVRQRGYITCSYCHTITLFYIQESHKPILGQPDLERMMYKVVRHPEQAGVLRNKGKERKGVLLLKGNLVARLPMKPELQGMKINKFGIREIPHNASLKDIFSGKVFKELEQHLAYTTGSDDSNIVNVEERMNYRFYYTIIGQIEDINYALIPQLENLREAAYIVTMLNDYLDNLDDL